MTKTFTIGPAVVPDHLPETFEVEVTVMFGDADHYETFIMRPFRVGDEEALTSLLSVFEQIDEKYPNGRGGSWPKYGFQDVVGFYSWFGEDTAENEAEYKETYPESNVDYETFLRHRKLTEGHNSDYSDWPWDIGPDVEADFEQYKIVYYDKYLVPHSVTVS